MVVATLALSHAGKKDGTEEDAVGAYQRAKACADDASMQILSEKFEAMYQGGAVHRLKEAPQRSQKSC